MNNPDILFKTKDGLFSYRVAGILIREGSVLLQHPIGAPDFAFPGGHVAFGETSEQALIREFKEEIKVEIHPERLLWIGENFFPWGEDCCHQICLYYQVSLCSGTQIPENGTFTRDEVAGNYCDLEFCWINLTELQQIELYPPVAKEKLVALSDRIEHFIYIENP